MRLVCAVLVLGCLCVATARAQILSDDPTKTIDKSREFALAYDTAPGTGVVVLTVSAEREGVPLDRQALVKLVERLNQASTFQATNQKSQGVFVNIPFGSYDMEVSAVGYLSVHKEMQLMNASRSVRFDIVLHRDPEAINLEGSDTALPAKARKESKRAVSALKSGNLKEAQKRLTEAYQSAPSSSDLNFLLGYLYFQKREFEQAGSFLGKAVSLNPHNAQALTLLGRTGLERQDYPSARLALEQAVMADPEPWLPHHLLADTYLHEKKYEKARDEAQVAITKGQKNASPAQLVLGQSLVNMGHGPEGIEALNVFLKESPQHPLAGQVRNMIAEIRKFEARPSSAVNGGTSLAQPPGLNSLLALSAPVFTLKAWGPPGVDDLKLALAPGVTCPTEKVMEESGKRVEEFSDNVSRFAAIEDMLHQSLDELGNIQGTESRKYNYVAEISEPQPGFLAIDEYRADKAELVGYPDDIAATGFAALALVFHPHRRDDFEMSCEGLGDWHGQASWLVHFRQREDRPNRMHSYKVAGQVYAVKLKGLAWIGADNFQIMRIESEMVSPMPEIHLLSEHQIVEYGPIPFARMNTSLWLPKSAEIYFDFRKHHYYRRHNFDHYMLYSVDANEKRKELARPPDAKSGDEKK